MGAPLFTSKNKYSKQQLGFTIVELLIVIVVIAILAAITIVAYNGIQTKSKASAAQSAVTQAVKKVLTYTTTNAEIYPADLGAAGVSNSASTNFQFSVNNTTSPKTFCVTATVSNISYYSSSTNTNPVAGACAGHGANGAVAVTNYAKRPTPYGSDMMSWTGYNAAGGHSTSVIFNGWNSKYSYRFTAGAAGFSTASNIGLEYQGTAIAVPANTVIYPSIHVRSSKTGNYKLLLYFYNVTTSVGHSAAITGVSVPANTWVRLTADTAVTVPSPADRMSIRAQYENGTTWATGDWIEVSGVSTAPGAYADGDSPGWAWTDTPGYSTSTGPQL